jgi:tetratricopeptide (TPR) repeat protein
VDPAAIDAASQAGRKLRPVETAPTDRAWARGVPEHKQRSAKERFTEGNALLKESAFAQAAAKYREALKSWDHPGIHYNLALALINLEKPLEVREHLQAALKYGAAPLEQDKFDHAKSYLKLLEQQIAPVEISCDLDGAAVSLDGQLIFHSPGRYTTYVMPGEHRVRAVKLGYETRELRRTLLPGKLTQVKVRLYTEEQLIEKTRRWPVWMPLAVAGGGLALGGAGVGFLFAARNQREDYDAQVTEQCASEPMAGCRLDAETQDLLDRGNRNKTIGQIAAVGGGLVFAGGVTLFVMNLPSSRRITPEERERGIELNPALAPGLAALTASGRF